MTTPRQTPRQASPALATGPRAGEKNSAELSEPYDLPYAEGHRPPSRPAYLIVVDQLRDWQPSRRSPSLAELLETRPARTREPEPRRLPEQATDNGTGPRPAYDRRVPTGQLLPDLALYERLIDQGTAVAYAQDCPVDHVTARRLAIWLAARPQQPPFAQGLARFINTGTIQPELKIQLRTHARSGTHADHAQAARLLRYCVARGTDLGPVAENFGAACHQLDRSDLMLADAHDRTWHGTSRGPERARPDAAGLPVTALAHHVVWFV